MVFLKRTWVSPISHSGRVLLIRLRAPLQLTSIAMSGTSVFEVLPRL